MCEDGRSISVELPPLTGRKRTRNARQTAVVRGRIRIWNKARRRRQYLAAERTRDRNACRTLTNWDTMALLARRAADCGCAKTAADRACASTRPGPALRRLISAQFSLYQLPSRSNNEYRRTLQVEQTDLMDEIQTKSEAGSGFER